MKDASIMCCSQPNTLASNFIDLHRPNIIGVSYFRPVVYVPKSGASACGVLSCRMSMNTENASKMEIPRDSLSPESTGTAKLKADKAAKVIQGMMIFRR